MTFPYTPNCQEACNLVLEAVPGAVRWPKRLICETHGYPGETRTTLISNTPDQEKPNNYIREVASPADVYEIGGKDISQY